MWPFKKNGKPVMYNMFGEWGNRIEWQDFKKRTVRGWKQRCPRVGDLIKCPMQSGSDGVFKITSVEEMTDPPDMFFAETEGVGYLDDLKEEYTPESEIKVTFLK
jgi:hypothetical protein